MNSTVTKKIFHTLNVVTLASVLLAFSFPSLTIAQEENTSINEDGTFETNFGLGTGSTAQETSNTTVNESGVQYNGFELQSYEDARASIEAENPNALETPADSFLTLDGTAEACITSLLSNLISSNVTNFLSNFFGGEKVPVLRATNDAKETGVEVSGVIVSPSMDGLAYCLANSVIEAMLRSTINWVKGDFDGKPAFIDDPGQFFLDYADNQVGGALDAITGGQGGICKPWALNIKLALILDYTGESYKPNCTLSDIINNVDEFIEGNFEDGGWTGWFELTQSPENNPAGSYLLLRDKIYADLSVGNNTLNAEIGWNQGFLSVKDPETGVSTTPGVLLSRAVSDTLNIPRERLTIADEFDELITELVNAVVRFSVGEMLDPFSSS